ncbi:MAG: hypothetical protein QM658_17635 [Gordonia sp. (in: high G+C Gram-positive bacteria)]
MVELLLRIAKAWVIAAVASLIVVVLIAKFTGWGRQFWRVTRSFFIGPGSAVLDRLAAILLIVMAGVRLDVPAIKATTCIVHPDRCSCLAAGNQQVADSGIHGFWFSLGTLFTVLATLHVSGPTRPVPGRALHAALAGLAHR